AFHHCKIKRPVFFTDFFKMRPIAAVSAEENLFCRTLDHPRSPKCRKLISQATTRKVSSGSESKSQRTELSLFPPRQLVDVFLGNTPSLKMRSHAQGNKKFPGFRFQFLDRSIVEVIVMIVGNQDQVNLGKLFNLDWQIPGKSSFAKKRIWGGHVSKHRINQDVFPFDLQEKSRMAKPDQSGWNR